MLNRDRFLPTLIVSAVLLAGLAAVAPAAPMTKINIVLKNQAGKPVDHASVVVRFVQGHSVVKLGKAIRTTFELRSNQEGEARIPSIPQGKILVQVIAKGYQTYGQTYDDQRRGKDSRDHLESAATAVHRALADSPSR